jgi:hypothetical protein
MKRRTMKKYIVILFYLIIIFPVITEASWTTKRLTYNSGFSESPAMAIDSIDHIHVVWQDNTPTNYDIYYKKK